MKNKTKWISIAERYPYDGERVLIFDAQSGEAYVGWNAYRHRVGGASTPGIWVLPFGETEDLHITHWMPLPMAPRV